MAQLQKCLRKTCEWLSIDRKSLKNCGSNSFWKGTKLVYKKIAQKCRLKHTIGESGQKSHYRKYCYQSWKMNLWQNIYQNVRLELEIWYLHHCKNLKRIWTENGLIWALIGLKTPVKVKMATAKHSKAEELCYMQGRAKIFVEINANSSNFGNNGYIPQQSKVPKCFNHFLKNQTCCIKCIIFPCILV